MKLVQRCPSSFLIAKEDLVRAEVLSLEEFYAIPYIQSWMKTENFLRFSMGRTHHSQAILHCEYKSGECSCIAFLTEHEGFPLPISK